MSSGLSIWEYFSWELLAKGEKVSTLVLITASCLCGPIAAGVAPTVKPLIWACTETQASNQGSHWRARAQALTLCTPQGEQWGVTGPEGAMVRDCLMAQSQFECNFTGGTAQFYHLSAGDWNISHPDNGQLHTGLTQGWHREINRLITLTYVQ